MRNKVAVMLFKLYVKIRKIRRRRRFRVYGEG